MLGHGRPDLGLETVIAQSVLNLCQPTVLLLSFGSLPGLEAQLKSS